MVTKKHLKNKTKKNAPTLDLPDEMRRNLNTCQRAKPSHQHLLLQIDIYIHIYVRYKKLTIHAGCPDVRYKKLTIHAGCPDVRYKMLTIHAGCPDGAAVAEAGGGGGRACGSTHQLVLL